MKPTKNNNEVVGLVDVLLKEGAVLTADAVVTVAGIPLIGLQLRLAIAGMTQMTKYGMLEEWDASLREQAREDADETINTVT